QLPLKDRDLITKVVVDQTKKFVLRDIRQEITDTHMSPHPLRRLRRGQRQLPHVKSITSRACISEIAH
ncbi:hypothetical protein, partial [Xanthomonas campestris]|uniref:hypothetical protein n=1 Tax=Xanthomonas campestris TaxID=339 RepID=UPI0039C11B46